MERVAQDGVRASAGESSGTSGSRIDDRLGRAEEEDARWRTGPAFNVQFATDTASQVIFGVDALTAGTDSG